MPAHFTPALFTFLRDLKANNSRDWWLANKARYEDEIRRPMEQLLEDVSAEFGEAKVFRPNRDTRFSKDKSPYKTNIAAVIHGDAGGSVYVSLGAVTWPGELDLAPDAMYDEIKARGEWVLR